jgi:uncharacterized membrane protein SpoIIM required for sporulation
MKEREFVRQNKEKWAEFEALFESKAKSPRRLSELFVQITDDLAYARTFYGSRSVRVYLNQVSQRVFRKVYRPRKLHIKNLKAFWMEELPMAFYQSRWNLLIAFAVFALAIFIGVFSSTQDSTFAKLILGEGYVQMTEDYIEKGDPMAVYKDSRPTKMFVRIALNNLRIDVLIFVAGLLFGIGSLYVILINGIMVGCFQYFFIERGLFAESALTIWQHGTLEMLAMVLAGAAGLSMGRGLAFPGTYTRLQSLRLSASTGIKMMLPAMLMTFVAAFIESWITRLTGMPDIIRFFVILVCLVLVVGYTVVYPIFLHRSGKLVPMVTDLPAVKPRKIVLDRHKSLGDLFTESFVHWRNLSKKLWRGILIFSAISLLLVILQYSTVGAPYTFNISYFIGNMILVMVFFEFFIGMTLQFGYYLDVWWLFPVHAAAFVSFAVLVISGAGQYRSSLKGNYQDGSLWMRRLLIAVPMTPLMIFAIMQPWPGRLFFVLAFPICMLWACIIYWEKSNLLDSFSLTWRYVQSSFGLLLGSYLGMGALSVVFLLLINSPVLGIYLYVVEMNLAMENLTYEYFQVIVVTTLAHIGFFVLLALNMGQMVLYYFHARELQYAHGLRAGLTQFGNQSRRWF